MPSYRQRMEVSLAERLRFQQLLSHLSARLSNVSAADLDREVNDALGRIAAFVGVEAAAFLEFRERAEAGRSWSGERVLDPGRFPGLARALQGGRAVRMTDLAQLPSDAQTDRASGRALGIAAYAGVPLKAGGQIVGGLMVAAARPRDWSDELMDQLPLLGEVVGNALAAARAQREADHLRQELAHIGRVSALGELTASFAHELNQPLTAILNNAEVAQRHLEAEVVNVAELRAIVSDIVADDKRAAAVIRRLRSLLQKGDLDRVSLDVNDLVAEVGHLVRNDAARRNLAMRLELGADLPRVRGDRVQLQQVVLNLVLNGLEAMGEPSRRSSTVTIRTSASGPAAVTVAIDDGGAGIDPAQVERLWHPLYTTKPDGLGMGLAIARTIIEAHGGRLSASNNAAGGATFEFTVPAEPAP